MKKATESNDTAAIERGLEQLTAAQHKAAESMYKQGAAAGGAGPSGGGPGGETGSAPAGESGGKSDVIDAEVVDEGKQ